MKVKTTHTTEADQASARAFFDALLAMYTFDGPVLDMFARNGELTVASYRDKIAGPLDLWELGPEHTQALTEFDPRDIRIGCSYQSMMHTQNRYEMIVVDTPQGLHKDFMGRTHTEHFGVMREIGGMLADHAVIVLYCNKHPYNRAEAGSHGYDEYEEYDFEEWMDRRSDFYGWDARNVPEEAMIEAYRKVLHVQGFRLRGVHMTPCHSDVPGKDPYAFRLGLEVLRGVGG